MPDGEIHNEAYKIIDNRIQDDLGNVAAADGLPDPGAPETRKKLWLRNYGAGGHRSM